MATLSQARDSAKPRGQDKCGQDRTKCGKKCMKERRSNSFVKQVSKRMPFRLCGHLDRCSPCAAGSRLNPISIAAAGFATSATVPSDRGQLAAVCAPQGLLRFMPCERPIKSRIHGLDSQDSDPPPHGNELPRFRVRGARHAPACSSSAVHSAWSVARAHRTCCFARGTAASAVRSRRALASMASASTACSRRRGCSTCSRS